VTFSGPGDPFGGDPFAAGGQNPAGMPPVNYGMPPAAPFGDPGAPYGAPGYPGAPVPPPTGEVNTLATLSVVFAFVFAPVGAVLGHLALSQIKKRNQAGRNRAILGTTLSYVIILLAIVALVIWLLLGDDDGGSATTTTTATTTSAQTSITSTVITASPKTRPTVKVEELQVGDCVEIQQLRPDPDKPTADEIHIYRAKCEIRDGVFQVRQMTGDKSQCPANYLFNKAETLFACYVKFEQ